MTRSKEESKIRYQQRLEKGICNGCGHKPALSGKVLCADCQAKFIKNNDERRKRLSEAGLCYVCGKEPALPHRKKCIACSQKDQERRNKRVAIYREKGLCIDCGHNPADASTSFQCSECHIHKVEGQRRRRKSRKSIGMCIECYEPICPQSQQFCQHHWEIYNAKQQEYYYDGQRKGALERDQFTCQICGDSSGRINVHHIDNNNKNNDPSNLITLCVNCHMAITHILQCAFPSKIIEFVKVHYQV
jgi:hypothetical protein